MALAEPVMVVEPLTGLGRAGGGGRAAFRPLAAPLAGLELVHVGRPPLLLLGRGRADADIDELRLVSERAAHEVQYGSEKFGFKN